VIANRQHVKERIYAALPIPLQNLACTWAGWRRARLRMGRRFHQRLSEWEVTGTSSRDVLRTIQRQRLARIVEIARTHVPYYRDLLPPSIRRDPDMAIEETLSRIPPLEKTTYRDAPERFRARHIPPHRLIRGRTSGTTGTALPLWYTVETIAEEFATVWRQRRALGVRIGDPNLTFNGPVVVPFEQTRPPFWRRNYWGRQTLFSLYHMAPRNLREYVTAIHELPATYVQGYPSSLHLVARAMLESGRPLEHGRLVAVFTSSESLLAFQRAAIEAAFGAPVRDRYGTSELAVSMTACAYNRLHVDMEFGIVEVEAVEETEAWVRGPLLVTGFANEATPFLRYRVGDVGTRLKRPCECGRPGDVFLDVDGRIEDYVATPDGRLIGRLDHVFKDQLAVAEAQILQDRPDAIEVRVVRRPDYDARSELGLLTEIRARLGGEIRVDVRYVDHIPREANGKFRAVKSAVGRLAR
jgi:phenylacetate-CoA ligase